MTEKYSINYWVQFINENKDDSDDIHYGLNKLIETAIALEKENAELKQKVSDLTKDKDLLMVRNLDLVRQNEKMKCFIHSEIDFCTYCPLTNECENGEGTCPYAYATEEEQKKILAEWITKNGS